MTDLLTAEDKEFKKAFATLSPQAQAYWRKRVLAQIEDHGQPARGIPYYLEKGPPCSECGHRAYRQRHG